MVRLRAVWMTFLVLAVAGTAQVPSRLDADRTTAVNQALQRGSAFLRLRQLPDGSWLQHPAVTSLAAAALMALPAGERDKLSAEIGRALDFILSHAKPDGSIWSEGEGQYPNYSTAVSLVALTMADREADRPVMRKARAFLMGPTSQFSQLPTSDPSYGGIGYGKSLRPDLSNTQWALEALHVSEYLDREPHATDPAASGRSGLAWERALAFLTRCQNLAETNASGWVMDDPDNRGGFIYLPGSDEGNLPAESKAGSTEAGGRQGLRSYGSMTYAGLKSMIYAKVDRDDVRVKAAVEWISRHYTFAENPGMGAQGLFYYLHTCAKALDVLGEETLTDAEGRPRQWRVDLAERLVALQKADGSWSNEESGRWMESIPELSTSYSMLALGVIRGLDAPRP